MPIPEQGNPLDQPIEQQGDINPTTVGPQRGCIGIPNPLSPRPKPTTLTPPKDPEVERRKKDVEEAITPEKDHDNGQDANPFRRIQ